jgi:hypothetical protein
LSFEKIDSSIKRKNQATMQAAGQNLASGTPRFRNILVVIKQTAFEEYSQVRTRRSKTNASQHWS